MPESHPERDILDRLLYDYNEAPHRQAAIEAAIDQRFRRTVAILVVDSCGFTRTTRDHGIVHFLATLERLRRLAIPLIARHGGHFLRAEADNLFARFTDPASALRCALALLAAIDAANEALPAEEEVGVSAGIGFGSVLLIDDHDVYGDEMNLACKLGEDLATAGEILLTPAAYAALPPADVSGRFAAATYALPGLSLTAYRALR